MATRHGGRLDTQRSAGASKRRCRGHAEVVGEVGDFWFEWMAISVNQIIKKDIFAQSGFFPENNFHITNS